ncbi:hypothetical protein ACDI99_16105 (plasmid) [Acinetobacter radioresistens]|uniref:hypothetical protein n=1 Tax=Acinetobacter radioresistens TaxID=40216 RepID=UPI003558755A
MQQSRPKPIAQIIRKSAIAAPILARKTAFIELLRPRFKANKDVGPGKMAPIKQKKLYKIIV